MRLAMTMAAIMALAGRGRLLRPKRLAPPGRLGPPTRPLSTFRRRRLAKLFATFGIPDDVRAYREDDQAKDDTVVLDYGAYGFKVRKKTVRNCLFWPNWKGTIKGIKIGDSRDDVAKVLGKPVVHLYREDRRCLGLRL